LAPPPTGLRRRSQQILRRASQTLNQASQSFREDVAPIAQATASVLLKPGLNLAVAGLTLILVPPAVLLLAPLMRQLLPVLLPLGFTLVALGMARMLLIVGLQKPDVATPSRLFADSPADGSIQQLNAITSRRGETLVRHVAHALRSNVKVLTSEMRNEIDEQLAALQTELQGWVSANPNLRPHSLGEIGWGTRAQSARITATLDRSACFKRLLAKMPPASQPVTEQALSALPLPPSEPPGGAAAEVAERTGVEYWRSFRYLLVPGLLTKWYPMYMSSLRYDLQRLGLCHTFSAVDTDQSVLANAAVLRGEIERLAAENDGHRVVLLCHSKGGVDAAASLALYPSLEPLVATLVTMQARVVRARVAADCRCASQHADRVQRAS